MLLRYVFVHKVLEAFAKLIRLLDVIIHTAIYTEAHDTIDTTQGYTQL